jgi:Putative Ig domain
MAPLSYNSISGGSSGVTNDFIISTGTSGSSTITLSKDFPSGTYVISSSLSDTSYDVYLVSSDGSSAGSVNGTTAQTTITATKSFNTVVIYGTQNNDTYTFTYKYVFTPVEDSSSILAVGPRITSLSTSTLANVNSTVTVTGKNFASNVTATFTGTDNVVRNAKSVVRNSSTQIVVTRPDDMPNSYQPYTLTLANPGIASPTSTNLNKQGSILAGSIPTWTTAAGDLSTIFVKGSAYSHTLSASDPDTGGSVTYTIVSGALPSGISLNSSTGAISGTSSADFGTYSFTVRVTDAGGNYVDRSFNIQNFISTDTDNFNRSTSGNLGSTSNRATVWTNVRGTWQADGSRAYSNDSAGTNAIATVRAATTNISNLQVDTQNTGGVGLAFWVTDANSWYAVTTSYSTDTSSSSSCTGGGSGLYEGSCPSICNQCNGCDTVTSRYYVELYCPWGYAGEYIRTGCSIPSSTINAICGEPGGGYGGCRGPYTFYGCNTTIATSTTTNYRSYFKLLNNGTELVSTQYNVNSSGYSSAGSMAVSTVGNIITYNVYSGANKSGLIHNGAYTASSPVKGTGVGIYKGNGGSSQGSYVDNFDVTVI